MHTREVQDTMKHVLIDVRHIGDVRLVIHANEVLVLEVYVLL